MSPEKKILQAKLRRRLVTKLYFVCVREVTAFLPKAVSAVFSHVGWRITKCINTLAPLLLSLSLSHCNLVKLKY